MYFWLYDSKSFFLPMVSLTISLGTIALSCKQSLVTAFFSHVAIFQKNQICGPWVNNDSLQSTHTVAKFGTINQTFTADVWINYLQQNDLIAHIKIGGIQLALMKPINVIVPKGE